MRTTEINKRRILDNDGITMQLLSHIFYQIQKASRSYDSLFAAFLKLSSDKSSTSLAMFAFKRLCLSIVIRKLCNSSDLCNKSFHYFMTSLGRNAFGTDIACSKLWLATFCLKQRDYSGSLQTINDVISSIPPYALYVRGIGIESKQIYVDRYYGRNTDILCRAKEAWLFDMHITPREDSFVPLAIQIELYYCDPDIGVLISPFTYAYYLMSLCYNGLGQYDNRDGALRQLVDTANDKERNGVFRHHSYNIAGNCMLMAGYVNMARDMFLKSAQFTNSQRSTVWDKYNAAYKYLSLM